VCEWCGIGDGYCYAEKKKFYVPAGAGEAYKIWDWLGIIIECDNCGECAVCTVNTTFVRGRILPGDDRNVVIGDALEILKYLAKMDSALSGGSGSRAWNAALILPNSRANDKPAIGDALEILKKLAKMDSIVE